MLQPDLFFSYGLCSGLALAAGSKLNKEKNAFVNKYFLATILWLTIFYIPQVLYLSWRFPAWESMFVFKDHSRFPAWLVGIYPVALIITGTLGFYVTRLCIKQGRPSAALALLIASMAAALFLITVGWDGSGYQRLVYAGSGADWARGVSYPLADFFSGPVMTTLLWLEALVLAPYAALLIKWARPSIR